MAPETLIRQAMPQDAEAVSDILREAARWLEQAGMALWREDDVVVERIVPDLDAGLFILAEIAGNPAGTMKFQLDDPIVWPDAFPQEATYIHRLAVRRRYAGAGVSTALLQWAARRTHKLGRPYLRLDCVASRPRLRAIYEHFGFKHHSDTQVGTFHAARYEYDVTKLAG
jgi:GNAT superfamily N-acetyltransferase